MERAFKIFFFLFFLKNKLLLFSHNLTICCILREYLSLSEGMPPLKGEHNLILSCSEINKKTYFNNNDWASCVVGFLGGRSYINKLEHILPDCALDKLSFSNTTDHLHSTG